MAFLNLHRQVLPLALRSPTARHKTWSVHGFHSVYRLWALIGVSVDGTDTALLAIDCLWCFCASARGIFLEKLLEPFASHQKVVIYEDNGDGNSAAAIVLRFPAIAQIPGTRLALQPFPSLLLSLHQS